MVDVQTEQTVDEAPKEFIGKITLKGGAGEVEINFSELPDETYKAILIAGAEAFIHKANGVAKAITGVTKAEGKDLADRQKIIREGAEKTVQNLKDGIIPGAKKAKASGAVNTEALRLAKNMFKDLVRNSGQKIGAYSAKEQTAAAKIILERNPHLLALAQKNLDERVAEAKGTKGLDLLALVGEKALSDEVKAKPKVAPKRKAKDGDAPALSAKQAGMVAPRQKPGIGHTAH